mgnify:CR=1 FL=1
MSSTRTNDPLAIVPNRARGTILREKVLLNEPPTSRSLSKTGDGPVMTSLRDLMTWDKVLSGGGVLSAHVLENLFKPDPILVAEQRPDFRYACGWMISTKDGKTTQLHGGEWMGTTTYMARVPAKKQCVIVLVNQANIDVEPMVDAVLGRLAGVGAKPKER